MGEKFYIRRLIFEVGGLVSICEGVKIFFEEIISCIYTAYHEPILILSLGMQEPFYYSAS